MFEDWLTTSLTTEQEIQYDNAKVVVLKGFALGCTKSAWNIPHFHNQFDRRTRRSMHASTVDSFIGMLHDDMQKQDSGARHGAKLLILDLTCGHTYIDRQVADQEAYVERCFAKNAYYHDAQVFIMPMEKGEHYWYMRYSLGEEVVVVDSYEDRISSTKYVRHAVWLRRFCSIWRMLASGKKTELPAVERLRLRHAAPQQQEDSVSCGVFMCVWIAQEACMGGPTEVDVHRAHLLLGASMFAGKNLL